LFVARTIGLAVGPYAVGPYAEGQYVAFVPWEILKPFLTPEGSKIFGGVRPKSDDEDP
jgi:hypothetical protein